LILTLVILFIPGSFLLPSLLSLPLLFRFFSLYFYGCLCSNSLFDSILFSIVNFLFDI
jgi:hypothetical protein